MNKSVYEIALKCKDFIKNHIEIHRNIVDHSRDRGLIFTDYDVDIVGESIETYWNLLSSLCDTIKEKYPQMGSLLKSHIEEYDKDKISHYSAIKAIVECIIALEYNTNGTKKIFISHSSKDKQIVSNFVDHILQLGIGLKSEDIFCTSIENMAIRKGENIRKHIQENIKSAGFAFLLISDNYKKSEICLNEMGAVWAYDANVYLYLLPNTDFSGIGWLCETRKADMINNAAALDALHEKLCEYYGLQTNYLLWSSQRETFLGLMQNSYLYEQRRDKHNNL